MNFMKRAILSMKKRIGTSLILMAVFLIVTNLVLSGFTIQNASKKAADAARKKLGADVTLSLDFDKLGQQARETGEMPNPPKLNTKETDQLAKSKHVKDYNYIANTFGISDGLKLVGASEGEEEGKGKAGMAAVRGGSSSGTEIDMNASFMIEGVRKTALQESFKNGKSKIIDGKPITEQMKNQNVALMEKRLAELNNLKVGDKVKVQSGDKKETLEVEIIGIYETNEQAMGQQAPPIMDPANKLYMPHSTMKKLEVDQGISSVQVVYFLNDPQYIDAFKKEAKKSNIDFNYYKLDAHDSLYKQMIGPIENISSTSQMIIYIVSIAGAIILGLIIMLSIKGRRKEMGILLSIGEKKWKLMAQFVVEVVCIAILAFGVSITTGAKVSQFIGDNLLSSEIATTSEETDTTRNNSTVMMSGPGGTLQNQKEDPIDKIDVSVTGEDVGKMGGIGLAIAIIATLLPALSILRLNPKQILLKDE
ncbi:MULTISPECIES: ABC transporter permease [Bacillus cereus group]|uniref:ABC3 transporter permease C-terminal domain-containing protein n=2 Tax=Bacillus cereus group TaxID=86661 RepID=A0A1C4EEG8_BACTU|nr:MULTISPECIES: ABC transporter permease [Bacillus cereus group]MCC2323544.1 ABC transporter permease [Bacillus wiedmannii]MED2016077.1 ABC transporter permease [Bacillus wiedmannii]MED3025817.1 ABC transporter permease [Bacillus wiedmannii]OTY03113.1 permease [Bacillus thuringiensis serovar wratislaviensis]OUB58812.1 permease [Bacillus thuringiensis serovar sylvestriensis]